MYEVTKHGYNNVKYVSVHFQFGYPCTFSFGTPGANTEKQPKCKFARFKAW